MENDPDVDRRRFLGGAAMALIASQFGFLGSAAPSATATEEPARAKSFGPLKEIVAGDLSVGYAEAGPG